MTDELVEFFGRQKNGMPRGSIGVEDNNQKWQLEPFILSFVSSLYTVNDGKCKYLATIVARRYPTSSHCKLE